jgi:hypothetical protein
VELVVRNIVGQHVRTTRNETIPRWSRAARLTLGVITFVLIGLFATAAIASLFTPAYPTMPRSGAGPVTFVLFLATFAQFLLMMFYVSFAAQNPRAENRAAWIASMIVLPFAMMPIYWWVHVWNAPYVADPERDYNVPGGQLEPGTD